MVAFDRKCGWDIFIKALGWGGCRAFTSNDDEESKGISDGLEAGVLRDGKTIRVKVPLPIIGEPEASWGYYVLIGSQDAFEKTISVLSWKRLVHGLSEVEVISSIIQT